MSAIRITSYLFICDMCDAKAESAYAGKMIHEARVQLQHAEGWRNFNSRDLCPPCIMRRGFDMAERRARRNLALMGLDTKLERLV